MLRKITLLAAATLLSVLHLAAQQPASTRPAEQPRPQPQLTFTVEVNYVEIDATVTDAQGNPVRDLSREDFEIREEGRPQALTVFSRVDIPVERSDPPLFRATAVEPDVRTNRREFDGRVFVLLLDDLHTSFTRTPRLRVAATLFIQRYLGANDLVAIVPTSGQSAGAQEFTASQPRLLRAVNQFAGRKLPSAAIEGMRSPAPGMGAGVPMAADAERAHLAGRLLRSVGGVADFLSGIRGRRKAVVLFSEGIDYDLSNMQNRYASDVVEQVRSAIGAATRGNVSVYTVDPRGLTGLEDAIDIQALPADPAAGTTLLMNELRASQDSLRVLAEETGGIAAVNRNDYRGAFDRIIRDNSSYYVLGYYTDNTRRDGRFRPVDVRVRRPGLVVRARKGYAAPRGNPATIKSAAAAGTSPELREALNSPVPVSGLGLAASAVPFRSSNRVSVLLIVEIDGSRFRFTEQNGKLADEIEVVVIPFDASGRAREGARDAVTITPRPETRDLLLARGVRITRRLDLVPGRYSLRVGARESGSGATGTVVLDLDIPDFSKDPLTMSGIAVASASANRTLTARADDQLTDVLPVPPTVLREFPNDDEVTLFAEVYDRIRAPHKVEITTTMTADDGKVVFTDTDTRGSNELRTTGDGFGHVRTIPLKGFAPGRYVARIEARGLVSGGGSAVRELEVTIR